MNTFDKKYKRYIVSISFANYLKEKSGMPKVLMAHKQMYNAQNVSYVNLFVVKKMICNDRIIAFCVYGLVIDDEYKGIFQMNQLIELFSKWNHSGSQLIDIHLHHFLYIKLRLIDQLLNMFSETPVKVYLHDYYIICSNYTLTKNGKTYCGSQGCNEQHCYDCDSYKKSKRKLAEIEPFLKKYIGRILFISPSQVTKDIICEYYKDYHEKVRVIPHQYYNEWYKGNMETIDEDEKIKIGFLGMPMNHKGWNVWKGIVEQTSNEHYEFYVFNSSDDEYEGMKKVKVGYSAKNLNAMTDALRKNGIHVVLLWASWPETYSYTCFEGFSANAFLITNTISGNITDVVRKHKNGIILENMQELLLLFNDPIELKKLVNCYHEAKIFGPMYLYENEEILQLSIQNSDFSENRNKVNKAVLVNVPLLILLRYLYNEKQINS